MNTENKTWEDERKKYGICQFCHAHTMHTQTMARVSEQACARKVHERIHIFDDFNNYLSEKSPERQRKICVVVDSNWIDQSKQNIYTPDETKADQKIEQITQANIILFVWCMRQYRLFVNCALVCRRRVTICRHHRHVVVRWLWLPPFTLMLKLVCVVFRVPFCLYALKWLSFVLSIVIIHKCRKRANRRIYTTYLYALQIQEHAYELFFQILYRFVFEV